MELTVDLRKIIAKTKAVLLSPKKFFKVSKKEKGWKEAFTYLLIIALLGHVLTTIYNLVFYPALIPVIQQAFPEAVSTFSSQQVISLMITSYVLTMAMSFAWGLGLKYLLTLFREDSTFEQAYRTVAYARTPNLLFSWLPILNLFVGIYSLYLFVVAIRTEYSVSTKRAAMIIISGMLIVFILSSVLIFATL